MDMNKSALKSISIIATVLYFTFPAYSNETKIMPVSILTNTYGDDMIYQNKVFCVMF